MNKNEIKTYIHPTKYKLAPISNKIKIPPKKAMPKLNKIPVIETAKKIAKISVIIDIIIVKKFFIIN